MESRPDTTVPSARPRRHWILRMERAFTAAALRLLRLRRQRERVARGFALGLVINFLPTFGFGVFVSGFLARVCGGHLAAGFIGGASLTPFWPILFYFNIRMGDFLLGLKPEIESIEEATEKTVNALMTGRAFMVGTAANMVLVGVSTYLAMLVVLYFSRRSAIAYLRYRMRGA